MINAHAPAALTRVVRIATGAALALGALAADAGADRWKRYAETPETRSFQRIATFPVIENLLANDPLATEDSSTVAEIVAATDDGLTLIYGDGETGNVGFVDITDPANPVPAGLVDVGGEVTSVDVAGPYAIAAVNTSPSFVAPSGTVEIIDIASRTVVRSILFQGQPDAVAVSPDGRFAAIAVENERDEDRVVDGVEGGLPQLPGGGLLILDLKGAPADWGVRYVDLAGVADFFGEDPEPEFVTINRLNFALVTLQENNHLILVNLRNGRVLNDFSAGAVDLTQIDIVEDDLLDFSGSLDDVVREPDGATFINRFQFATADEGDFLGGSRGFTIFDIFGRTRFTSGNSNDLLTARIGHYPEGRSENKGNEIENVAYGRYGKDRFLFVGSERSSVVFVYDLPAYVSKFRPPRLKQILPANIAPEGLLAIPSRGLFVAASEEDARDDKVRSSLNIYALQDGEPSYPTIVSADSGDGTPIGWAALSALAVDPADESTIYTVYDSFYKASRIFVADRSAKPAEIVEQIVLQDTNGLVAAAQAAAEQVLTDAGLLDQIDGFVDLTNDDGTVNLDPEGIAVRAGGGFWVASEGAGTIGDTGRAFSPNLIVGVAEDGTIDEVIALPDELIRNQVRFGFEGVASVIEDGEEVLYAAIQRPWADAGDLDPPFGDAEPKRARLARYDGTGWTFAWYPLDDRLSPNGGWVGLSEIVPLGEDEFAVVERDNQGGRDARIKQIATFSVAGVTFKPQSDVADLETVAKTVVRDLIPDLEAPGGAVIEKVEGLAALADGTAIFVTDNDGVDDSSGETQYQEIPDVF